MTANKPHFSASSLSKYLGCGMAYRFHYLEKLREPKSTSLMIGSAVHVGAAADLTTKIETGMLMDTPDVLDAVSDAVDIDALVEEPQLSPEEKEEYGTVKTAVGAVKDEAIRLSGCHHAAAAPMIEPVYVERPFRIIIPDFPRDLIGYMDVVEAESVRDLKTTGKAMSKADADTSIQMTCYTMALKVLDGIEEAGCYFDVLVRTKTPRHDVIYTERGPEDWQRLLRLMEGIQAALDAGVFLPAPPGSWKCSERWCGYWSICDFGRKNKTQF